MSLNLPTILGFDLVRRLGGGPICQVVSAVHRGTGQTVAIKFLNEDWSHDETALTLFQREIEVCLSVRHPHLVETFEASWDSIPPFFVMEYLPGETLRKQVFRQKTLPIPLGIDYLWQTASALNGLHQSGFIHGDVKPDNLLGLPDRSLKLIDMGFAHRPGENQPFWEKGYTLGTANYLAPELCRGQLIDDFAGDIFSLGVTFFELFTGQLPYPVGTVLETLTHHSDEPPLRLDDFAGDWPKSLIQLLDQMMARDPLHRPHAAEIVRTLQDEDVTIRRAA